MIQSEKAYDMLPYVSDIYEKLKLKDYIKKNKVKEDEILTAMFDLSVYVMKHSPKIKEEIFTIVAIAQDSTIEEVKQQSLVKTLSTFKDIFTNEELVSFFKLAVQ